MNGRSGTRAIKRAAVLAALALAALPAAAQARVVEPVWVTGQTKVAANTTAQLTLRCPAKAVALNGAAPTATSSIPAPNARRWTFRFTAGARAETGRAVLRCVRLRLPDHISGVGLEVGSVYEPIWEVPPGFTQTIAIKCPTGQVPTGWGLERSGAGNGLEIAAAVPTRKGWRFDVENTGPTGATGSLGARCLVKKQRASTGQRHVFSLRVASFTEQLEGAGTTIRSCSSNEYSVATGVDLPAADDIALTGTTLIGNRSGEWNFSQTSGATPVKTTLICLARNTGFHR